MAQVGHEAEEVKEVVWTYTGWAVILLVCVGAGVFIGHLMWGDAALLRTQISEATEQVNMLKNERETIKTQLSVMTRDKEVCQKKLEQAATAPAAQ